MIVMQETIAVVTMKVVIRGKDDEGAFGNKYDIIVYTEIERTVHNKGSNILILIIKCFDLFHVEREVKL